MGTILSNRNQIYVSSLPREIPDSFEKPTFDPQYGFTSPRKPKEANITIQEMKALKMPKKMRDYCAQYYRDFLVCMNYYTPFHGLCKPEVHAYEHCKIEDYTIRMKEYEREKRLRMREMRKEGKAH